MSKLLTIIFIFFFLVTMTSTLDLTKSYLRTQQCTGNTFKCTMGGRYICCINGKNCNATKSGISCSNKK